MITAFHVLGVIDLRRVKGATIEIVMDTGEVFESPCVHADVSTSGPPNKRGPVIPRLSRKVKR